jgi:hypothetical protein
MVTSTGAEIFGAASSTWLKKSAGGTFNAEEIQNIVSHETTFD